MVYRHSPLVASPPSMEEIADRLQLQRFQNPDLLACVLLWIPPKHGRFLPRLERRGDAILNRIIEDRVNQRLSNEKKRQTMHYKLYSNAAFAMCAQEIDLVACMPMTFEIKDQVETLPIYGERHILADVFECLVAAIMQDQGLDAVVAFLDAKFWPHEKEILARIRNQKRGKDLLRYCKRLKITLPITSLDSRPVPGGYVAEMRIDESTSFTAEAPTRALALEIVLCKALTDLQFRPIPRRPPQPTG